MPLAKVAWLCEYPLAGGGDRSLLATLDGVRAAGFEPVALTPARGELAAMFASRQIPIRPVAWYGSDGVRLAQPAARSQLASLLAAERPDLLHANSLAMARLAGPVAVDLGIPSIGHLRDIVGLSAAAVADLNRNTRLLAVSQATREFHLAQGVAAEKTLVLYNGVDLDHFAPSTTRPIGGLAAELQLQPDALLIGCIGQIIQRKGQDLLSPLANRLQSEYPAAHLLVIGDCPSQKEEAIAFHSEVRRQLSSAAPGRVHFLGRRSDVAQILPQLALLVHPARQEPLGRVLLEAAACGLAIVATQVGGTAEIFPPQADTAELVPVGDGAAIAAAVGNLLNDPERRARLAAAARQRAAAAFDARHAAAGLVAHYAAVLDSGRVAADAANR